MCRYESALKTALAHTPVGLNRHNQREVHMVDIIITAVTMAAFVVLSILREKCISELVDWLYDDKPRGGIGRLNDSLT